MQDEIIKSTRLKKITLITAIVLLLFTGFISGKCYETTDRTQVYILNEAKFLKLTSMGLALADKDTTSTNLAEDDKARLRATMKDLSKYLNGYSKHPVLIQQKNNQGYELYSGVKKIDITEEVIIKLIGKDKWEAIGKALS